MASEDRDEAADALGKLARGEAAEPEASLSSGTVNLGDTASILPSERPAAPLASGSANQKPASVRPPAPGAVKPVFRASAVPPPQMIASQSKVRPAVPIRAMPQKDRPAAPLPPENAASNLPLPPSDPQLELSSALANVVEGSDVMFAPAPEMSVLTRAKVKPTTRRTPYAKTLHFRQTMIPILLMLGVSLPGIAVYWLLLDRDSLLRSGGAGLPIVLTVVGIVMLLLAVMNMFAVRHELQQVRLTAPSTAP